MYSELIGRKVTVIIFVGNEKIMKYDGILASQSEEEILLQDASFEMLIGDYARSLTSSLMGTTNIEYMKNIDRVIINKRYIISCAVQ